MFPKKIRYARIGCIHPGDMGWYSNLKKLDLNLMSGDELKQLIRKGLAELARHGEGELVIVPESWADKNKGF